MEAKEERQQVVAQAEVPMVLAHRPSPPRRKEEWEALRLKVQARRQEREPQ